MPYHIYGVLLVVSAFPSLSHPSKTRRDQRKAFDRSFATGMDAAIAYLTAMEAAAEQVELPMKRARKDTAFAPRKKARISSIKESSLMDERSESEPLGSYWTIVPDRRGDMISVCRSHRLSRS